MEGPKASGSFDHARFPKGLMLNFSLISDDVQDVVPTGGTSIALSGVSGVLLYNIQKQARPPHGDQSWGRNNVLWSLDTGHENDQAPPHYFPETSPPC